LEDRRLLAGNFSSEVLEKPYLLPCRSGSHARRRASDRPGPRIATDRGGAGTVSAIDALVIIRLLNRSTETGHAVPLDSHVWSPVGASSDVNDLERDDSEAAQGLF
jgi:hypothetical protein